MKPYSKNKQLLGAFAALSFAAAASAQTAEDPAKSSTSTEQGTTGTRGEQQQMQAPQTSETQQMPAGQQPGAAAAKPRAIDPREVQQVFGQQASVVNLNSLSTEDARNLQQRLKDMGYYQGEVDGVLGGKTRQALNSLVRSQFVLTQRMVEQGQVPSHLAQVLGLSSEIMPMSGTSPQQGQMAPPQQQPQKQQQQKQPQTAPPPDYPPAPSGTEGTQGEGTSPPPGQGTQGTSPQGSGTQGGQGTSPQ